MSNKATKTKEPEYNIRYTIKTRNGGSFEVWVDCKTNEEVEKEFGKFRKLEKKSRD